MNVGVKKGRSFGFKRKLVQVYAAVLYNCYVRGFIKGDIYTGKSKLLCVPGLNCYSCPGAVGACPLGALQNAIASSDKRLPSYVVGIILLYGLLLGRTICGWLCPVGLIQELFNFIPAPKLRKSRATKALSYLKYFILFAFVIMIPYWYSYQSLPLPAFCKYICPAGTFEGAIGLLSNPANSGKLSMLNILFTRKFIILVALLLACVFVYRAFCRFLCPLGAIYGLFSRFAIIGVKLDKSNCTSCGRCVSRCKMDIRRVGDHECIHCGECIDACPTGAISFKAGKITLRSNDVKARSDAPNSEGKRNMKRYLVSGIMLIALVAALVYFNRPESAAEAGDGQTFIEITENTGENEGAALAAAPAYTVDESIPIGKEVGRRAPDFSVTLYGSDETFTLSENLGSVVVVNFWATWCTPCCLELPHFDRVYTETNGEVKIIALHSNLVTDDPIKYLEGYDYSLMFAPDADGGIIASFGGSTMLPMTVVIDPNGVITYNSTGSMTYEKLTELIARAEESR